MDLVKFTDEDPLGWVYQSDVYFDFHGIAEEARLQIVGFHMIKEARGWIRGLKRNKMLTTWSRFKIDLMERFGDSPFEDKLEELSRLQQTTTVAEYMARFEVLMNEIDQSEEALISYFVGGLKQDRLTNLKKQLKVNRLTNLRRALAIAKVYESNKNYKFKGGNSHLAKDEPILKTPQANPSAVPIIRRTLTVEERKERTTKGLCFDCEEKYSPGHRCKGRMFQMDANQECLWEWVDAEEEKPSENINE